MVALREIFESLGSLEEAVVDEKTAAHQRQSAALELGRTLRADFDHAVTTLRQLGAPDATRRALVRCFGSLIDGLANAMGAIAELATGRSEKFPEANECILHRINFNYRTIGRALPASPLTSLHARRWDDLKACLEIRNRVLHPQTPSDLEITDRNIRLLTEVAGAFISDFETLAKWQTDRPTQPARPKSERRGRHRSKLPCANAGK